VSVEAHAGEIWAKNSDPRNRVTLREWFTLGDPAGIWFICEPGSVDGDGWNHDGACCWVNEHWLRTAHVVHYGPEEGIDCDFCNCRHERREFACNE